MQARVLRLVTGFVTGALTVILINHFVWPGTLVSGLIGVMSAVAALSFAREA